MSGGQRNGHFLRHVPADPGALDVQIEAERALLARAVSIGQAREILDHAGNLGAMLTGAGREAEGHELLAAHLPHARRLQSLEESGWLINALATAEQYLGNHEEADRLFAEALQLSNAGNWSRLEHFVLHHWGRCLAQQARFAEARTCFSKSLAIRESLDDPLQTSSRRALAALRAIED